MRKNLLIVVTLITSLTFVKDTKANPIQYSSLSKAADNYRYGHDTNYTFSNAGRTTQVTAADSDSIRSLRGEILFSNEKISISSVYPNPASAYASIDYHLSNDTDKAKIILCNVLGNVVGEYFLIHDARTLHISTLELNSGVYFYTLSLDGKSLVTRKLIIKHHS